MEEKMWDATSLEALKGEEDVLQAVKPKSQFFEEYESLCHQMKVPPHPQILPRKPSDRPSESKDKKGKGKPESNFMIPADQKVFKLKNFVLDAWTTKCLGACLMTSCSLSTIRLFNASLSEARIVVLASAVAEAANLRELSIDFCPIEDCRRYRVVLILFHVLSYADLLHPGSKIHTLSLRGNGLTEEFVDAFLEKIKLHPTLQSLNLFSNKLGDSGAAKLAAAFRYNSVLKALSLARNNVGSEGVQALFGVLGKHKMTPELLAERQELEEASGGGAPAKGKKKAATKSELEPLLEVEEDGEIVQYCRGSKALETIDLCGNPGITAKALKAGLMALVEAFETDAPTRYILAEGCGLDPVEMEEGLVGVKIGDVLPEEGKEEGEESEAVEEELSVTLML